MHDLPSTKKVTVHSLEESPPLVVTMGPELELMEI